MLKDLIEDKVATLKVDVNDKDQYGGVLRCIFLNDENVNIRLVEEGLATVYIISPNVKYKSEPRGADEAKSLLHLFVNLFASKTNHVKTYIFVQHTSFIGPPVAQ